MFEVNWYTIYLVIYLGVYISENTYVRTGEQSLDSFYKPFHLVVYYKFLRFFPDGKSVLSLSSYQLFDVS